MNSAIVTCPMCHGDGVVNNPPTFYDAGKAPEPSITCDSCKGTGKIEVHNPAGTRVAVLVAKRIVHQYPHLEPWERVYDVIAANISNAVNVSTTSAMWARQNTQDLVFDDDILFSEDELIVDAILNKTIDKGFYMDEARTLLNLKDKED